MDEVADDSIFRFIVIPCLGGFVDYFYGLRKNRVAMRELERVGFLCVDRLVFVGSANTLGN